MFLNIGKPQIVNPNAVVFANQTDEYYPVPKSESITEPEHLFMPENRRVCVCVCTREFFIITIGDIYTSLIDTIAIKWPDNLARTGHQRATHWSIINIILNVAFARDKNKTIPSLENAIFPATFVSDDQFPVPINIAAITKRTDRGNNLGPYLYNYANSRCVKREPETKRFSQWRA